MDFEKFAAFREERNLQKTVSTDESPSGLRLIVQHVERPALPGSGALFLDRDGVINERIVDGYVLALPDLRFCTDFLNAFQDISSSGAVDQIIIVSNQACVGKGLLTLPALHEIMLLVVDTLKSRDICVSAWLVCPHTSSDDCTCRKPKPGMLFESARRFGVDLSRSCFVGDSQTDIAAGSAAGCKTFLVNSEQPSSFLAARTFVTEVFGRS